MLTARTLRSDTLQAAVGRAAPVSLARRYVTRRSHPLSSQLPVVCFSRRHASNARPCSNGLCLVRNTGTRHSARVVDRRSDPHVWMHGRSRRPCRRPRPGLMLDIVTVRTHGMAAPPVAAEQTGRHSRRRCGLTAAARLRVSVLRNPLHSINANNYCYDMLLYRWPFANCNRRDHKHPHNLESNSRGSRPCIVSDSPPR